MNINEKIQILLAEVKKGEVSNELFSSFGSSFVDVTTLEKMAEVVFLDEEHLSLSFQVEERVQLQGELNFLMDKAKAAYHLAVDKKYPDWLVKGETDEKNFEDFFVNFGIFENGSFYTFVEQVTGKTPNSAKLQYENWKELLKKEELKHEQVKLVQHAIDLEALLVATLRVYGLSGSKIKEKLA